MRKVIFAFVFLALCVGGANAQQPQDGVARHTVTGGVWSMWFGTPTIGYEYRIGCRSAVFADLGFAIPFKHWTTKGVSGLFLQAQYRVYPWKQKRNRPNMFIGFGLNYAQGWNKVNVMTGNDGWDIETTPYMMKQARVRPALTIGIKVNIPFGLTLENSLGILLAKEKDGGLIQHNLDYANYAAMLITMKIGWSFDGKRHAKAVEPYEEPAVEMEE